MFVNANRREHAAIKYILNRIAIKKGIRNFYQEEARLQYNFLADFYVPSENLVIEVNSMLHYVPYTEKEENRTRFKSNLCRGSLQPNLPEHKHYKIINMSVTKLEGLILDYDTRFEDWIMNVLNYNERNPAPRGEGTGNLRVLEENKFILYT